MEKKNHNLGKTLKEKKRNNKRKKLYKAAKTTGLEREENYVDYGGIDGSTSITELNSLDDFIAQAKLQIVLKQIVQQLLLLEGMEICI